MKREGQAEKRCGCSFQPTSAYDYCAKHRPVELVRKPPKRISLNSAEMLRMQRNAKRYVFLRDAHLIDSLIENPADAQSLDVRIDALMKNYYAEPTRGKERACITCGLHQLHWARVRGANNRLQMRLVNRKGEVHVCKTSKFQPRIKS